MSIVLVIIALLAASIVVGSALIKNAQMNKMMTQIKSYEQAAIAFNLKYGGLPGDIQGSRFFGTYCQKSGYGNTSCDGNNNKIINQQGSGPTYLTDYQFGATPFNESTLFWRHLFLANMITEDLTGVSGQVTTGSNIPSTFFGLGIAVAGKAFFVANYSVASWIGTPGSQGPWTPQDMSVIDLKYDDGLPNSGTMKALGIYNPGSGICFYNGDTTINQYNRPGGAWNGWNCTFVYEWLK